MQPTLQALASFQNALREALVQQDWAAIGALDAQCRALIGKAGVSDPALYKPLEELSRIYAELQQAARAERERIAGELTRLNQSIRVDQMYKAFG